MSEILILSREDVEACLTMEMAVRGVENAYRQKAEGKGVLFPLVTHVFEEEKADMDIKSGHLAGSGCYGFKLVSWFGDNPQLNLPALHGVMMLFDDRTGEPKALLNASAITRIRTGAAGAVGALPLALPEQETMLMLGTGAQSASQIAAMLTVMPQIRRVFLASHRGWERARERCASIRQDTDRFLGENQRAYELIPVSDLEKAVRNNRLIVTATSSRKPLIMDAWVQPGTHFSCMGADMAGKQEIDGAILKRARIYADDLTQSVTVGECELPVKQGMIRKEDLIGELGSVLTGSVPGRLTREDITVFDSSGIALQDLVVAAELVDKAGKTGKGRWIKL
ncbi:MAG: ornithine cyclodeaminase family protein [Fusicatenibacter sp.]